MNSIGEFLLKVTILQVSIAVIAYVVFLALLAYKKPSWYRDALKIFAIITAILYMYSLG
jgi:hypothetical protein